MITEHWCNDADKGNQVLGDDLSHCCYVQVSDMAWLRTALHPVKSLCQIRRSYGLNMCVCVCARAHVCEV
jgi:hypothetical protein